MVVPLPYAQPLGFSNNATSVCPFWPTLNNKLDILVASHSTLDANAVTPALSDRVFALASST